MYRIYRIRKREIKKRERKTRAERLL